MRVQEEAWKCTRKHYITLSMLYGFIFIYFYIYYMLFRGSSNALHGPLRLFSRVFPSTFSVSQGFFVVFWWLFIGFLSGFGLETAPSTGIMLLLMAPTPVVMQEHPGGL